MDRSGVLSQVYPAQEHVTIRHGQAEGGFLNLVHRFDSCRGHFQNQGVEPPESRACAPATQGGAFRSEIIIDRPAVSTVLEVHCMYASM
jgi:hypothetical protein